MDMIGFFEGRVVLCGEASLAVDVLEYIRTSSLSCESFFLRDDRFFVTLSSRDAERVRDFCGSRRIDLVTVRERGLPRLMRQYRKRVGIWCGCFAAAVLIYACSQVVWDINITGNETLEKEEILAMLAESGLEIGTYLGTFDNDRVEMRMMMDHREIGWVAVNVRGTTANVEILETVRGEREDGEVSDLVATREGQIERIEAFDGDVRVKVGDVVRKGDLLVSGLYDNVGSLRMTRAEGSIFARTVREFDVEIPLKSIQKVYTGREWSEKSIIFFSKRIKVFTNTGNVGSSCDIIYRNSSLKMPGGVSLPIGIGTTRYREYEQRDVLLNGDEAMSFAFDELDSVLERFVTQTGAELLSKTIRCELDDVAYRIHCTVTCIEDIACEKPIDIS